MEIIKKPIIINHPIKSGNTEVGVDGDIIVPDVKPDILKILQVDGTCVVTGKELSESRLQVTGRIDVNILYVPDRQDEKIKSIRTSFDFSHRIDKNSILPDMHVNVDADIEKIDFQVLNSRKIRIKSIVSLAYDISEHTEISLATGIESDENAELCVTPMELINLVDSKQADFTVRESFELPPGQPSVEELLKIDVKVSDTDYKVVTGRVIVKGTLNISCLYLDTSCCIRFCDFETQFTEIFDVVDADESTICDIDFFAKEVECNAEEDSDGDTRVISAEILIGINICATQKVCTDVLVDCFCPGMETQIIKKNCELEKVIANSTYQLTIRESVTPPAVAPALKGIYNVFTKVNIEKTEVETNKISVSGNVYCFILYIADSEDSPVYSMKKEFPFSCVIDTPNCKNGMDCTIAAQIIHTSYNLTSSSEAEIRCILSFNAKVSVKNSIELIDDLETAPLSFESKKGIVIYFVQKNDTLWDIAKRYYVSQSSILSVNSLGDDAVITEGMKLVIPTA